MAIFVLKYDIELSYTISINYGKLLWNKRCLLKLPWQLKHLSLGIFPALWQGCNQIARNVQCGCLTNLLAQYGFVFKPVSQITKCVYNFWWRNLVFQLLFWVSDFLLAQICLLSSHIVIDWPGKKNTLEISFFFTLEGTAHYAGLLLAPAEVGFLTFGQILGFHALFPLPL